MFKTLAIAAGAAALSAASVWAQDDAEQLEPRSWETRSQITADGERVRYRVVAGETFLRDEDGAPTAAIFSTSYLREGVEDPTSRPVAFIFNGGPGSASLWLHMGVFGPKRVVLPSNAEDDGAAPFDIRENPESLIDEADMVFIDPVGTGGRAHWAIPIRPKIFGASTRTPPRSRSSFGGGWLKTGAGTRLSISSEKATARPASAR